MSWANIAAYVGFFFISIITSIGAWLAQRLYGLRHISSTRRHNHHLHIVYSRLACFCSLVYISIGIVLLVQTILRGEFWGGWCWRWSIVGSLLDSLCVIKLTKENQKPQRVITLSVIIAAVETLLIIISPAIPSPIGAQYLTFGAVVCHVLWTALSATFWKRSQTRIIRLGASLGQGFGAIALIWNPLGFVILFCSCSAIVCIEELKKSQQPLLPTATDILLANNPSTPESRRKYKIVFLGQGSDRMTAIRHVTGPLWNRQEHGGIDTYEDPTRGDTIIASVNPRISLDLHGPTFLDFFITGATALVVVINLCDQESIRYVQRLRGFPREQLGLLVAYRSGREDEMVLSEDYAQCMAMEHGWDFTLSINLEQAFEHLLTKMFAKPRPSGQSPALYTISSSST